MEQWEEILWEAKAIIQQCGRVFARTGSGNHNYKYSAKGIRATLAKEYPALDVEKMVEQILRIE